MAVGTQDLQFRVLASVVGAQALDGLQNQMKGLQNSSNSLATGLRALAGYFSAQAAVQYGKGLLDTADSYEKLSEKTGIAVETIAEFAGGAEEANVPLDALAKGLNRLGLNLVQAANGNKELSGTFSGLGISIKDSNGNLKNAGDVAKQLADKFSQLKDGPEKSAIAIKLFGRAGADLIPFFDQGTASIQRFSLSIDTDFATRAEAFNNTLKAIGVSLKNGTIDAMRELLPSLQEVASSLEDFANSKTDSVGFFTVLGEAARLTAQAIVVGYSAAAEVIDRTVSTLREGALELKAISGLATDADAAQYGSLKTNFAGRQAQRDAAEKKFLQDSSKNSLLFGNGSSSDILDRQKSDTTPAAKSTGGDSANTDSIGEYAKILQAIDQQIAKVKAETAAVDQSNQVRQAGVLISELESKGINSSSKYYETYKQKILDAFNALATAQEKVQAQDFQRTQEAQIALQQEQIENYSLSAVDLAKLTEARTLDNQATETSRKFTEDGKAAYLDAVEAVKKQRLALLDLQQQQKETFSVGARQAFKDYVDSARDVAAQTKNLFANAFANMEDALVNFVKSGKLNFSQFADSLITDIIRIQVRMVLAQAVTGASGLFAGFFGSGAASGATNAASSGSGAMVGSAQYASGAAFANGGIMTARGAMSLRKYAAGGIASSPQLAMFGEGSTPEAYVPLQDGRSIPVTVKAGQGGGGNTTVSVSVNVEKGTESTQSNTDVGKQLGKNISAMIKQELINQKRPGGLLA